MKTSLSLSVVTLALFACGSPGELGGDFPPFEQTGYAGARTGAAGTGVLPQAGTGGVVGQGGTGNTPAGGTGGAAGGNPGGSGNLGGSGNPGGAGPGGTAGTGGGAPSGQCPDDITVLFNRPSAQGGCADGGCHTPGGLPPDLTSPNPEARLLNVISNDCGGRPYIGANDSLLAEKLLPGPSCGTEMPFFAAASLSPADEACILDWIDEVAGN